MTDGSWNMTRLGRVQGHRGPVSQKRQLLDATIRTFFSVLNDMDSLEPRTWTRSDLAPLENDLKRGHIR